MMFIGLLGGDGLIIGEGEGGRMWCMVLCRGRDRDRDRRGRVLRGDEVDDGMQGL